MYRVAHKKVDHFSDLLYVHIYGKLHNFIQLSLNLTKLCHIKYNHPVKFHFSTEFNCTNFIAKDEWPPNSPHLNPLDCHAYAKVVNSLLIVALEWSWALTEICEKP